MNHIKTGLVIAAMTALFLAVGRLLGGQQGMVFGFVAALVMNAGAYWFSDRIVLSMYRAQPITPADAPQFYQMVDRLCQRADLPVPALYVIPDPTPNAFATGRDPQHAAVAVHQGLLNLLSADEVEGVVAHELAHIKNRDTLISTITATLAGAITMIVQMAQFAALFGGLNRDDEEGGSPIATLALLIVSPLLATLLQLMVSRSREYLADATGAQICGKPLALADALRRLESGAAQMPAHGDPATAHMFIINPLRGDGLMNLFRTHPATEDRVARLENLAAEMGVTRVRRAWR